MIRGGVRRVARRLLVAGGVSLALLLVAGLVLNLRLMGHLDRVEGAFDGLATRPRDTDGTTVLLLGTLPGASGAPVEWLADRPTLESVMLVDIPPGTPRHVSVESLPVGADLERSVTAVRPGATVGAVEAISGRRVEHLVVVDWSSLQRLADDNGSGTTYAPGSGIEAQQTFLEEVLEDALHAEMRKQPWSLHAALDTVSRGMAVDEEWSMLELDLLVLSLRDLRSAEIEFSRR